MPRIIDTDNFDGDYPDEHFHLMKMPADKAKRICDILNIEVLTSPTEPRFYKVVPDDYKLKPGFEP